MRHAIVLITILAAFSLQMNAAGSQFPAKPGVTGQMILSEDSIAGDGKLTGVVKLNGPATADLTFNLSSSNAAAAEVESATVTIRSNQNSSPRFSIKTKRVTQNTNITITAATGKLRLSKSLAVTVRIDAIKLTDSAGNNLQWVCGGQGAKGLLVMSGPVPAGAQAIVTSSDAEILRFGNGPFPTASGTATINPNSFFMITTKPVDQNKSVTVSATYNGVKATKSFGVGKPQMCGATIINNR